MLDHSQLSDYQVEPNSTLFENGRVRGGGDDAEMKDVIDMSEVSDQDIMEEVMRRGLMDKLIQSWLPALPPIPDIANKSASLLNSICDFLHASGVSKSPESLI